MYNKTTILPCYLSFLVWTRVCQHLTLGFGPNDSTSYWGPESPSDDGGCLTFGMPPWSTPVFHILWKFANILRTLARKIPTSSNDITISIQAFLLRKEKIDENSPGSLFPYFESSFFLQIVCAFSFPKYNRNFHIFPGLHPATYNAKNFLRLFIVMQWSVQLDQTSGFFWTSGWRAWLIGVFQCRFFSIACIVHTAPVFHLLQKNCTNDACSSAQLLQKNQRIFCIFHWYLTA